MKKEDCYYLGYIIKALGIEGGLLIALDTDDIEHYESLESVFILIEGKLVPFFIEDMTLRPATKEAVVHFEDVDTIAKARHLCGQEVYLPIDHLPPLEGESFYFHEIAGYQAYLDTGAHIGEISKVLDFPGNPVFSIMKAGKETLIPVADELITAIDHDAREIRLNPPPGLLDLYH